MKQVKSTRAKEMLSQLLLTNKPQNTILRMPMSEINEKGLRFKIKPPVPN